MPKITICTIPDCGKLLYRRCWCTAHYLRWRRHGNPLGGGPDHHKSNGRCSVDGCDKPHLARSWCSAHYSRWEHHGDPLGGGTPMGDPERYLRECTLTYQGGDCLIWPYARSPAGYARVTIEGKTWIVSRYVCEKLYGPPPTPEYESSHECGQGHAGCVSPKHLSWKTHTENMADKIRHGTQTRGETHQTAKLSNSDAIAIRTMRGSHREIAERYGVSRPTISRIKNGKRWTHLES